MSENKSGGPSALEQWKRSFAERLGNVQAQWVGRFRETLDTVVGPVFDDLAVFLRSNGFAATAPLREDGRRSFKFELAEDAYVLLLFKSTGVGEFELSTETFAPGCEPRVTRRKERLGQVSAAWTQREFQTTLNAFLDLLGGGRAPAEAEFVHA